MDLTINKIDDASRKQKTQNESQLGFGDTFTDHMFTMKFSKDKGWYDAKIEPYNNLSIDPATSVLHYGQGIFEGMKAYYSANGKINLFRPDENFKRFNRSATRMCMEQIDEEFVLDALKKLLIIDKDWIPRSYGTSLYIRPVMIATDIFLGVRRSSNYLFFIICSPVGSYYKGGFKPISIYATDEYVRAAIGGTGDVKTIGNYAASLYGAKEAKNQGFDQVMWLDAINRKYIDEVGTMNIFFVFKDKVVTPKLTGSILPGITRKSVIQILKEWDIIVEERLISINEVMEGADSGDLVECFGTGTAVIIAPVGKVHYKGVTCKISNEKTGELSKKLHDEIFDIQYGVKEKHSEWIQQTD